MEKQKCKICGIEKNLNEFYYRKDINRYRKECKKCLLEKQKLSRTVKVKIKINKINPSFKVCTKCNFKKSIDCFRIDRNDYVHSVCYECEKKENMQRYYNKKMLNPQYVINKEIATKNAQLKKENRRICLICKKEKSLNEFYYRKDLNDYRKWCIECEKNRTKGFYQKNKDIILNKQHESYLNNRDIILKRKKDYAKMHKEQLKDYHTKYVYNRRNNDEIFHFKSQVRHLINQSFRRRGIQKKGKTEDIVGCDFETFSNYLLETFKNNYGYEWDGIEKVHIDHKKPLSIANTEEEILKLCHYTNLQLLKAKDNFDKKDKLDWKLENNKK